MRPDVAYILANTVKEFGAMEKRAEESKPILYSLGALSGICLLMRDICSLISPLQKILREFPEGVNSSLNYILLSGKFPSLIYATDLPKIFMENVKKLRDDEEIDLWELSKNIILCCEKTNGFISGRNTSWIKILHIATAWIKHADGIKCDRCRFWFTPSENTWGHMCERCTRVMKELYNRGKIDILDYVALIEIGEVEMMYMMGEMPGQEIDL